MPNYRLLLCCAATLSFGVALAAQTTPAIKRAKPVNSIEATPKPATSPNGEKEAIYKRACVDTSGIRGELTGTRKQDATGQLTPITPEEVVILERERGRRVEEIGDIKILSPCECLAKYEEKTQCGVVCPPPEQPKQPEAAVPNPPKEVVPDAPKEAVGGTPRLEGACNLGSLTGGFNLGAFGPFGILCFGPIFLAFRQRKKK